VLTSFVALLASFFHPTAIEAVGWILACGFFGGMLGYVAALVRFAQVDPLRWSQHVAIWAGFLGSGFFVWIWLR
jgi:hypothetical protein